MDICRIILLAKMPRNADQFIINVYPIFLETSKKLVVEVGALKFTDTVVDDAVASDEVPTEDTKSATLGVTLAAALVAVALN